MATRIVKKQIEIYIAIAVFLFLLLLLLVVGIDNLVQHQRVKNLQEQNATLLADATMKRIELDGLTTAVEKQNHQVSEFEQTTQRMAEARTSAQAHAQERIKQLQARLVALEAERASGCSPGGMRDKILREVQL